MHCATLAAKAPMRAAVGRRPGSRSQLLASRPNCSPARARTVRGHVAANVGIQEVGWLLAEASKAGSVDAPGWVLPVAAAVIAVVGGGSAILLKPGDDAAKEMQERDRRKFNKYD